ncbi:MAG: DUF4392 domain-containing protein [Gemmataceae bacterium]|nr:DUF4392 domain-containing protein [Gemmataceae bacterium]MCI0737984.1 DUF4392 domain-containing protein [Gemmataceae bacterium]
MSRDALCAMRELIQIDIGKRGLAADPTRNLINAFPDDFAHTCEDLAGHPKTFLAIVTGFYIPTAQPPAGETDGPLGAVFLARALGPLGIRTAVLTDQFCASAVEAGLRECGLESEVPLAVLPDYAASQRLTPARYWQHFQDGVLAAPTHLLAIERVGPSHTLESLQQQTAESQGETILDFCDKVSDEHLDRCHTMRGRDITEHMSPAHWLFEEARRRGIATIGIGDGGNEIGMGRIPWQVIRRNIPGGGVVACRVATDRLIVAGISNWGAYGLAAGLWHLRDRRPPANLFNPDMEQQILQRMVEAGPLVDGVSGLKTATVDGCSFDTYGKVLTSLSGIICKSA